MSNTNGRSIEGSIGVWLPNFTTHIGPSELQEMDAERLIRTLNFTTCDMTPSGWTHIGEAKVSVRFDDTETVFVKKVEALRAEKAHVLAEAKQRATKIEQQIQTLLAITHDPQVVDA